MSGFSRDWLTLREPLDMRSRAVDLTDALQHRRSPRRPLRLVDLGTGTGANVRYLAPRLGGHQEWLLVDQDPMLLAALPDAMQSWRGALDCAMLGGPEGLSLAGTGFSADLRLWCSDLASDLDRLRIGDRQVVTASALLDLVSLLWLKALARACQASGAAALFALTYDGRLRFRPPEAEDAEVAALVNRHQLTDKGFGPALGPAAARTARALFAGVGYRVRMRRSDWHVGPDEAAIQQALLAGWAAAARAVAPEASNRLDGWYRRRLAQVKAGCSRLDVGHLDLLALPFS